MKTHMLVLACLAIFLLLPLVHADGALDTDYGLDGRSEVVTQQPDGKIPIVGTADGNNVGAGFRYAGTSVMAMARCCRMAHWTTVSVTVASNPSAARKRALAWLSPSTTQAA